MKKPTNEIVISVFVRIMFSGILLMSFNAYAQNNEPAYFQLAYMKVKPGMHSEYIKMETEAWKAVHKERIKQGKATGWYLYEVMYPSGTEAEYDYVIVNSVNGWNAIDNMWDGYMEMARKVLNKDQLLLMEKTEQTRDLVKQELWAIDDAVFDTRDSVARFLVVNYMDIPAGKWEEYYNMEINMAKPVHQADIKAGGRAGWALYSMELPYSDNRPYDAAAVDFYYSWDAYGSSNSGVLWEKIHPDKSEEYVTRQINESRKLVKQDVLYLIDYVD